MCVKIQCDVFGKKNLGTKLGQIIQSTYIYTFYKVITR